MNTGQLNTEIHVVNLSGPLNEKQFEDVTGHFHQLTGLGVRQVVVNLTDVPLIDSRGLAALVAGYKLFGRQPANFRLAGLQDQPRLVFELTGFDTIFQLFDTVPAAAGVELRPALTLPVGTPALLAL